MKSYQITFRKMPAIIIDTDETFVKVAKDAIKVGKTRIGFFFEIADITNPSTNESYNLRIEKPHMYWQDVKEHLSANFDFELSNSIKAKVIAYIFQKEKGGPWFIENDEMKSVLKDQQYKELTASVSTFISHI